MTQAVLSQGRPLGTAEFVALMALLTSLVALSVDAILPAFPYIATDLNVADQNHLQFLVTFVFLGMSVGQLVFGPVSDRIGRKPAIYIGMGIFVAGALLASQATSLPMLLAGRFLQGAGAAAPKVVIVALIRDQYSGREMARITSFVMAVFIAVPAVAPMMGQITLMVAHWPTIFYAMLVQASVATLWLALRQPETLAPEHRRPISPRAIGQAAMEIARCRPTMLYTVGTGLIFASFMTYLATAQPIFSGIYGINELFPLYFSSLALVFGAASVVNGRIVRRFGMQLLCKVALSGVVVISILFLGPVMLLGGQPPLWTFMVYLTLTFFFLPLLFGNLNALAMEPLGHVAGTAATMVGSVSTFIGLFLSMIIGSFYDNSLTPIVMGFAILGAASLMTLVAAEKAATGPG
ncbi:multidrug effflux MFS transporter [Pseudovibrio sp. SPO723]|uniref:multidrug effflux MFS transporter n=1 Tax=Nesiotobacter zosterae TaxID=392721 RepID=UPI0029C2E1D7|nr:multidrug effflux MFS transporter [Pseudovibrio sp. SPO723]MDX5594410.1 multidrug effflux MFS transporter [Pseudovibrio sp. SPO723]